MGLSIVPFRAANPNALSLTGDVPHRHDRVHFVPTLQPLLSRVIPLPATIAVKHPNRIGGALSVPPDDGVPAMAVQTMQQIAHLQPLLHCLSICNRLDIRGQSGLPTGRCLALCGTDSSSVAV
jgi:hypothetical protein